MKLRRLFQRYSSSNVNDYSFRKIVEAEEKFRHKMKQGRSIPSREKPRTTKQHRIKNPIHDEYMAELWAATSEQVFELLERSVEANIDHGSFFQQAMLKLTKLGDLHKAQRVFELMRKHEFRDNLAAWNAYFRLCARIGDPEAAISARQDMKRSQISIDQRCYTALIESYGTLKRLPELLEEYDDLDFRKDLIFFTSCVKECARTGDIRSAETLYKELTQKKIVIDCVFCNEFLGVLKAHGNVELSRKYFHLFDEKLKGGMDKDIFTRYLSIIQFEGKMEEVEWVLNEMKQREIPIDEITIFYLGQALAYAKDVDRVLSLIEDGVDVFPCLVLALYQTGRLSEVTHYISKFEMLAQKDRNYSAMFGLLYRAGELNLMDEVYEQFYGPERIPIASSQGYGLLDFHRHTVGVAVASLRFQARRMASGDERSIIVGKGNHQRNVGNSNLKESLLKTSALESVKMHPNLKNPGRLLMEKI